MSTAPGPYLEHHNFVVCAGSLLKKINPKPGIRAMFWAPLPRCCPDQGKELT